jgi:hypothetical protein
MIVTFKTKAYPDIIMFGDVAKRLLGLMGHSGTVPSALLAADIGAARDRLLAGLEEVGEEDTSGEATTPGEEDTPGEETAAEGPGQPDREPRVTLRQRAFPLLELLAEAERRGNDVIWE